MAQDKRLARTEVVFHECTELNILPTWPGSAAADPRAICCSRAELHRSLVWCAVSFPLVLLVLLVPLVLLVRPVLRVLVSYMVFGIVMDVTGLS